MVFEPSVAPVECVAFMAWYDDQTAWSEPHDYHDPSRASPKLRAWYDSMRTTFPAMNGPDSTQDEDNSSVTAYSIGTVVIYAAFAWTRLEDALVTSLEWAVHHRLGFFDASASGKVWLPVEGGDYRVLDCGEYI